MPVRACAGASLAVVSCRELHANHRIELLPENEEFHLVPVVVDEDNAVLVPALPRGGPGEQEGVDGGVSC